MKILSKVLLIIFLSSCTISAQESPSVFIYSGVQMDLTPKQAKILAHIKEQKTTQAITTVQINPLAFDEPQVKLNISPLFSLQADTEEFNTVRGVKQWFGKFSDSDDSASFVVNGQNVTGTIQNKDNMYSIKPLGGGVHVIVKNNTKGFPPDHPPSYKKLEKQSDRKHTFDTAKTQSKKNNQQLDVPPLLSVENITVLVAYTTAVDDVVADVNGLIELAINETNQSYANSRVNVSVELVGAKKTGYAETGNFDIDLGRLSANGDGFMDELHDDRNTSRADIVVLMVTNDAYCGKADAILADENSSFAIVNYGCATGYYSFGHEIGHLQGARHNLQADSATNPFKYGHGYYLPGQNVRTIMSYDCYGGCRRLPYWSNPAVEYNGSPFGNAESENNSRVLQETLPTITRFR